MLSEITVTKKINTVWFHSHEIARIVKLLEIESRMVVSRNWREKEIGVRLFLLVLQDEKVMDTGYTTVQMYLTLLNCTLWQIDGETPETVTDLFFLAPKSLQMVIQFSSVQSLSCVWPFATPWTAACQASLSITNSQSPPKPMSIESVMPSNHLILCCPLLLLPSICPSIRVFSSESALQIRWPTYWSFNSPTPQFKSINFSVLNFLYSPTLTSTHDHWKNHNLDLDEPLLAK